MKKVIIFGASCMGLAAWYSLDDYKYQLLAFIDNNKEYHGSYFHGVYVDDPKNICMYDYDFIIIPCAEYEHEMKTQLLEVGRSCGMEEEQIIVYYPDSKDVLWEEPRMTMLRYCIKEIKEKNIAGDVAELGVYKGQFAKYLNRYFPDRYLYLFDTFEGFSEADMNEAEDTIYETNAKFVDTTIQEVLDTMPYQEACVIRKGYFPDTAIGLEEKRYCFVSIDADLYKPILSGLKYFYPRLSEGGYIFVHDYNTYAWGGGVKKAVREFASEYKVSYVPIMDRCGSVIFAK